MSVGRIASLASALVVFVVLATANSGGYRYGISDQAFYEPAIRQAIDPALFPRDTPLIKTQSHLMGSDKLIGGAAKALGVDLPPVFLAIYLLTLVTLAIAGIAFARALGFSTWATTAFLLALTLRHRIMRTGANTLEGYMHPRQLAFALGMLAAACVLRRRTAIAGALLVATAALHSTTGLWFVVLIAPMVFVLHPAWRKALGAGAALAVIAGIVLLAGPLSPRLVTIDAAWLAVLADKDYLFPTGPNAWPVDAWIVNLAYLPIVWAIIRHRERHGLARAGERALLAGMATLSMVFLASVPFSAMRLALAVQLQVPRVFWLEDFIAMAYLAWWLTSSPWWQRAIGIRRASVATVAVLAMISVGRAGYIVGGDSEDRPLVEVSLPDTPWVEAMRWLRTQPPAVHVLADPGHAWRYGVSVRVAAQRDTVLESIKDSALAMYDRSIAMRVGERTEALTDFDRFTTADMERLSSRFDVDVLVSENTHHFELPVLYQNSQFTIYRLR